jgi:hypothetical protein
MRLNGISWSEIFEQDMSPPDPARRVFPSRKALETGYEVVLLTSAMLSIDTVTQIEEAASKTK